MNSIVEILDLGFNYVPCLHTNTSDIFFSLVNRFGNNLYRFNSKLFFEKQNQKAKVINDTNNADKINKTAQEKTSNDFSTTSDSFECIIKSVQKKNLNHKIFKLQHESLNFRAK